MRSFTKPRNNILIIAEIGMSHGGSLACAQAYVAKIAKTGVNAVKFQTHIASAESTLRERFRLQPPSRRFRNRYEYWEQMEFKDFEWARLHKMARKQGLMFLSSPFSIEAVDLLERVGVEQWKIASGEIGTFPMLKRILKTKKPVILSTGMSPYKEIDKTVRLFRGNGIPVTVLQATSRYPCPFEQVGLNVMLEFRNRYGCPVGLSDHSGTIYPALAAAALGASIIEVHVNIHTGRNNLDASSSLTLADLRRLVEGVRAIEKMLSHPVDKDRQAAALKDMRLLFTKSIVARMDLRAGTVIRETMLNFKKPGTGLSCGEVRRIVKKKLRRAIRKDELILMKDVQ